MPKYQYAYITPRVTETGLWCEVCQLPSAVRVEFDVLADAGVTRTPGLGQWCADCAPD